MKRVFVSYSRQNLDVVARLIQDLKAVGVDTWHDQALTGGQPWWDKILANIRECDIFIFALSTESLRSEACRSELAYVVQLGKPLLPVLVSDGVSLNLLSHPLNEIQIADCRSGDKESIFTLVRSIMLAPAAPPLPDPLPAAPRVPVSYLSGLNERIEASAPLTLQEQRDLLDELEEGMRDGRSRAEIRDLLLKLKRRDELLAKIATKIDAALASLDEADKVPRTKNEESRSSVNQGKTPQGPQIGLPPMPSSTDVAVRHDSAPAQTGFKSRRYSRAAAESPQLIADVKFWLESQNFETQQMNTDEHGLLLQVKKRGGWRDVVGMATSLNVVFCQSGDTLTVQIGAGKWVDKIIAGGVSMLYFAPLAITAGVGAWQQMKLPDKIFDFIGSRLAYK